MMSLRSSLMTSAIIFGLTSAHSTRETKLGPKMRSHLESADHFEKVVDTDQTPQVQLRSYVFD